MGETWIDKETPEGRKFIKEIKAVCKKKVSIGFQAGKSYEEDGTDIASIAAWNELGTSTIPARPFLKQSVDENEAAIRKAGQRYVKEIVQGKTAEQILNEAGVFGVGLVQKQIRHGVFVPNAPATVARKKSDKPLIDTGRMRQSVHYVIKRKWEK